MWFSKGDVVGLDIGSNCIKAVQLASTHRGILLKTLAIESLPPTAITKDGIQYPDTVANTIAQMFKQHNIKNKNVALSLAGPSVSVKKITIPSAPMEELPDMVRWEADQYIPFDPTDAYIDFQLLPTSPEAKVQDLLLVVAKMDRVQSLTQVAQKAGLTPVIMDSSALALENQYETNYPHNHEVVALLDIGASIMNLNILQDGSTIFVTSILGGGDDITRAIQEELNLNQEEAELVKRGRRLADIDINHLRQVIQEVSEGITSQIEHLFNCFNASHPGKVISRILLSGGVALFRGFTQFLARRLGRPVKVANPLKGIMQDSKTHTTNELSGVAPLAAVGVGLALRRLGDKVYRPLASI